VDGWWRVWVGRWIRVELGSREFFTSACAPGQASWLTVQKLNRQHNPRAGRAVQQRVAPHAHGQQHHGHVHHQCHGDAGQ